MTNGLGVDDKTREHIRMRMATFTFPFMTSICRTFSEHYGEVGGTGTYLALKNRSYVLTCEHVITKPTNATNPSAYAEYFEPVHCPENERDPIPFQPFFHFKKAPYDLALGRVESRSIRSDTKTILLSRWLAPSFTHTEGEVYFIHGYPGVNSYGIFALKERKIVTFPFCTFLKQLPDCFDPNLHFALDYDRGIERTYLDGNDYLLPNPDGLSGSLVWKTNVVSNLPQDWDEHDARVVGIIRKDDFQDDQLIATRIEPIIEFLFEARRREAAYFRWTSRGAPHGDALSDWLWAESEIHDLDTDETCQVL